MDSVTVTGYNTIKGKMMMGGISTMTVCKPPEEQKENVQETPKQALEAIAYPNPIKAGGQLTISLRTNDTLKQVQLFSSSGALVNLQSWSLVEKNISVLIPASLTAGVYFVRIVSSKNQSSTVRIVVN